MYGADFGRARAPNEIFNGYDYAAVNLSNDTVALVNFWNTYLFDPKNVLSALSILATGS